MYLEETTREVEERMIEGFAPEAAADAIFVSCTNLRAIEALPLLKPQFKPSIVTSTTATLEAILSMTKRIPPGQPELAKG